MTKPRRRPRDTKSSSSEVASTISGTTMGSVTRASSASCRAEAVPVEGEGGGGAEDGGEHGRREADDQAVAERGEHLRRSAGACRYQSRVKPSQVAVSLPWLNEKTASTRIGAYRKR